jgi:galactokinase
MDNLEQQIENTKANFLMNFNVEPTIIAYAPGRINIIGEHTDYNRGLSMPTAINRWVVICISPNNKKEINVVSKDFGTVMKFSLGESYAPQNSWEKYVYGCIEVFEQTHPIYDGFNMCIAGNVPIGSGVSSSAALEVACMNALNKFTGSPLEPRVLVKLCQRVEHEYLEVNSGLLDQYTSQFSREGNFMVLDFNTNSHQYITINLNNYCWVLCDTKVSRTLAGSKYSERVKETKDGLLQLQQLYPEIKSFRDIKDFHLSTLKNNTIKNRLLHYVSENKRVNNAIKAIAENDIALLGELITASHISLRDLYEVSCPELDFLVETALSSPFCLGSRMMGGGFGGCTINLVEKTALEKFKRAIENEYQLKFNIKTEINIYQSVNGAGIYPSRKDVYYTA